MTWLLLVWGASGAAPIAIVIAGRRLLRPRQGRRARPWFEDPKLSATGAIALAVLQQLGASGQAETAPPLDRTILGARIDTPADGLPQTSGVA